MDNPFNKLRKSIIARFKCASQAAEISIKRWLE